MCGVSQLKCGVPVAGAGSNTIASVFDLGSNVMHNGHDSVGLSLDCSFSSPPEDSLEDERTMKIAISSCIPEVSNNERADKGST